MPLLVLNLITYRIFFSSQNRYANGRIGKSLSEKIVETLQKVIIQSRLLLYLLLSMMYYDQGKPYDIVFYSFLTSLTIIMIESIIT